MGRTLIATGATLRSITAILLFVTLAMISNLLMDWCDVDVVDVADVDEGFGSNFSNESVSDSSNSSSSCSMNVAD